MAGEIVLSGGDRMLMPRTFTVPTTVDEVTDHLSAATEIVFRGKWATAAYVYAWTEEAQGRRTDLCRNGQKLSMSDFAALGIRGLTKPHTVAKYRKAWEQAIEMKIAEDIGPGDTVTIPDVDFSTAADNHRAKGTGENEWYTPAAYIEMARAVMGGIDLDPATSHKANEVVQAEQIFTRDDDGLTQEWSGRVWLNPPYSQPAIAHFSEKAAGEYRAGRVEQAIVLTHNYTDTGWFHILMSASSAVCFTRGRIAFESPTGEKAAPTQGQAFFYLGGDPSKFVGQFSTIGLVLRP